MPAESKAGSGIGRWIEDNMSAGKVTSEKYMGQSSWATSHRYDTDSGKSFFCKVAHGTDGAMFKGEALGLQAMYDADTLKIPKIHHHGELSTLPEARNEHGSFIIMEFLQFGGGRSDAHELGVGLAKMHLAPPTDERAQQGQFGFAVDNTIGGTHQANGWLPSWVDFLRERRLKPLLQQAQRPSLSQMGDLLCRNLDTFFEGIEVKPALLHGDLWSGNMTTVKEGGWAILDPAVYYGHHEAEFGMSWCAGFSSSFWKGYRSVIPEDKGFKARHEIYTLYHILNHYCLFGGGYGSQCESILRGLTRNLK